MPLATSKPFDPALISLFKKYRYLMSLKEDDFRDTVVRTLFLRQGMQDGRDLCGTSEKGKDAIFYDTDRLGYKNYYAIQTKKGPLNLSRKHNENIVTAVTQLHTALSTPVPLHESKEKVFPSKAILCCSGRINDSARAHIVEQVKDVRVAFMDADDLIPKIDTHFPELWLGIDTDLVPYLRGIRASIDSNRQDDVVAEIGTSKALSDPATDGTFVSLQLHRTKLVPKKEGGKIIQAPEFEEFSVAAVTSRQERLILMYGDAGAGKTTALRRIAYVLAGKGLESHGDFLIPIFIRAIDIRARTNSDLIAEIASTAKTFTDMNRPCFSSDDLLAGKIVLLVDGLDEIADQATKEAVAMQLVKFHEQYSANQIIIAARDNLSVRNVDALDRFTSFRISPINFRQAEQILKRFEKGRSLSKDQSNEILRRLEQVHGMELNPLLVTVFAATSDYARKDIPANITELFKKYTEMMLGRWNANKGLSQQYHAPLKDFLLCCVAFEMHKAKATSIKVSEFTAKVSEELKRRGHEAEVAQLTDELLVHSGLLRIIGDCVEFRHLLLQEFFAGRGIQSRDAVQHLIISDWWMRPLVFYFGQNPGDAEIFADVQSKLSGTRVDHAFCAAITLGLGLQACYLMETRHKVTIFPWIIATLADSKQAFLTHFDPEGKYPLHRFLSYYLVGRDGVACSFVKEFLQQIEAALLNQGASREDRDSREFWLIVSLLEAGYFEEALSKVETFNPTDTRLLLGIHLSCYMIENLRMAASEERKLAERIGRIVEPKVAGLRRQLLAEWKSELLEFRQGQIAAVPCNLESGTSNLKSAPQR